MIYYLYPKITATANITSIFELIRELWLWVYNSLIGIRIRVGNTSFSLMGIIFAIFAMSIIITLAFNTIRSQSVSTISNFDKTATYQYKKELNANKPKVDTVLIIRKDK